MSNDKAKIIAAVRAKAEELSVIYSVHELATVKAYTQLEVCALLDEIDQLAKDKGSNDADYLKLSAEHAKCVECRIHTDCCGQRCEKHETIRAN